MQITIDWSDKLKCPTRARFQEFAQKLANRWMQGHMRYGVPDARKRYMTRLEVELAAYKKSGNAEHLFNIANYCGLEMIAPENPKFTFDPGAASVTRGRVK